MSSAWTVVNTIFVILIVANLFGIFGLYAKYYAKMGSLGLWAFVLCETGLALFVALGVFSAFIVPVLARNAATLLDPKGPLMGQSLAPVFSTAGLTFAIGFVLLGVSILRLRIFPRWSGILLIIGAPVLGLSPLMPALARMIGCAAYGIGHIALGYGLWSEKES